MHTLLYGGTFDPIHHGHLITCQRARELLHADKVTFIPARISPHKTTQGTEGASAEHRLAMIQLALQNIPHFTVDPRELHRPGPSYTIDTIEEIQRDLKAANKSEKLTLLLGADQLPKLHAWHRIADLLNQQTENPLNLAIQLRSPRTASADYNAEIELGLRNIEQTLGKPTRDRIANSLLPTPRIDISATDIRHRVRQNLPIDFLVPPPVAAYIHQHNLYK